MRVLHLALAGVGVLALACKSGSTSAPTIAEDPLAGPGSDSCAVYLGRRAPGVRCQEIDHARCQCELVGATDKPAVDPAPDNTASSTASSPTPPPSEASMSALLEFTKGPPNTIVQCMSGPCPTRSADFITQTYPPIPIPAAGATLQLEFRAPDHKPFLGTYKLVPGRNTIPFSLEREFGAPKTASFQFHDAPSGTTVECVSGPCTDKKAYPPEAFPEIPLNEDGITLLLRFKAPGYRTALTSFQVRRGVNTVPVLMERAPLGK